MSDQAANDLARMAYDQYAIVTGGKNYQGLPMPAYADLGETIQAAWQAAVMAVVRAVTVDTGSGDGSEPAPAE